MEKLTNNMQENTVNSKEPIFQAKNFKLLNKAYKPIFNNFSFQILPNQIWMVMGPNGIGKSSLWEALIGLRPLQKGEIWLNGENITSMEPADRVRNGMKYIAQNNALFEDVSVYNNLMIVAESLLTSGRKKAVSKAVEKFDLKTLVEKKANQLSGGQRRRVELAKIMIGKAILVMLDEPFAAIDEEYTEKIAQIFQEMQTEGTSFLINDHNTQSIYKISNFCIHLAHATDKKEAAYIETIHAKKSHD